MRLDSAVQNEFEDDAITTIILSVPDSLTLQFIDDLLMQAKLNVHVFYDTNEDYQSYAVKTAICTEPIEPSRAENVLSYLPLWDGK
jgi:hypothetical protein